MKWTNLLPGIWLWRVHLPRPGRAAFRLTVRNPLPRKARLEVSLVGPTGWTGSSAAFEAAPRAEASCDLHIDATAPCRRQPIAVDLVADGQPFGQVAEALVTVGGTDFRTPRTCAHPPSPCPCNAS